MPSRACCAAFVMCLAWISSTRAGGAGYYFSHLANLRLELEAYVEKLQPILDREGIREVKVGPVVAADGMEGQHADVVSLYLREELQKKGITVSAAASLEIKGNFEPYTEKETGLTGVKLALMPYDANGPWAPGNKLSARLAHGNTVLASLMGVTADYPSAASLELLNETLVHAVREPSVNVQGGVVRAGKESVYGMELVHQEQGNEAWTPLPANALNGHAIAKLERNQPFAIRLHNRSAHAAAVTLAINGVNTFTFTSERNEKTGDPAVGFTWVPAQSTVVVKGWHRGGGSHDAFAAGTYPDVDAIKDLPQMNRVLVTAIFAAAWRGDDDAPKNDPSVLARCGGYVRASVLVLPAVSAKQPPTKEMSAMVWAGHAGLLGNLGMAEGWLSATGSAVSVLPLVDESNGFMVSRNVGWTRSIVTTRVDLPR